MGSFVVNNEDWVLFPRDEGHPIFINWTQGDTKRRERYYVVECFTSSSEEFLKPKPSPVTMYIAAIYYENRYGIQDVPELKAISDPTRHMNNAHGFSSLGEENKWIKFQLSDRFYYGQDKLKQPTNRWIVYHPVEWKPTQANFPHGGFGTLVAQAIPSAITNIPNELAKGYDPTKVIASTIEKLGLWDTLASNLKDYGNNLFGDALYQFGAEVKNINDDELINRSKTATEARVLIEKKLEQEYAFKMEEKMVMASLLASQEYGTPSFYPDYEYGYR